MELSKYAEDVGADGVMILPPYYLHPDIDGVYEHYKTVAQAINIGIVIYHNPWTTKVHIGPELMSRLAETPNIIADKECHDMGPALRMLKLLEHKMVFSMGWGEYLAPYYYMSAAKGHVTVVGNFAPQAGVEMY